MKQNRKINRRHFLTMVSGYGIAAFTPGFVFRESEDLNNGLYEDALIKMRNPIHINEWKYIHVWRIEVYRNKGEITPLKDIYNTRSFQNNEPLGIIEHSIEFKDAKNLIEKCREPIVPGCEPSFDEIQEFAIGYLLDSVKSEIRDLIKNII